MPVDHVFPRPVVKQVIFRIDFPNLFFLESKIGEFQIKVMAQFPQSELVIKRQVLLTDASDQQELERRASEMKSEAGNRQWQFRSEQGVQLNVGTNFLSLVSETHKSYKMGTEDRFRDVIESVLKHFIDLTHIPIITRLGLRYIDECPIPAKRTSTFEQWYNSILPLDRFPLETATAMDAVVLVDRDRYKLRYAESVKLSDDGCKLVLDFDGFTQKLLPEAILDAADELHVMIRTEFERTAKQPLLDYMDKKMEAVDASA